MATHINIENENQFSVQNILQYFSTIINKPIIIKNQKLYDQSVTHESVHIDSYEILEFLGDSVIGFIIANYLYKRFPTQNESFLTELKIKIVNSHMLSWLCRCIKLHKLIRINNTKTLNYEKIYEDVFESFIGAFYIENDLEHTKQVIIGIIENPNFVDMTDLIINDYNYKKKLMITFQKNLDGRLPVFHTLNFIDTKLFHIIVCHPNGDILGIGISKTIKMAQQSACKMALQNYILKESEYHSLLDKKKFEKTIDTQFNEKNIKISQQDIIHIWNKYIQLDHIQSQSINVELYQSAFIHKSYLQCNQPNSTFSMCHSNERLNFLGNSLLMYFITEYLYWMYPGKNEGFLTKIKTSEIQNKNIFQYCQELNLNKYLILTKSDEINRMNSSHSEQLFCSLLAAMYLDQGILLTKKWVFEFWKSSSKMTQVNDENYKHQLLLKIQENPEYKFYKYPFPTYNIVHNETNYEKRIFTIEVYDPKGCILGKGVGKTKKEAEQNASKDALSIINNY